MRPLVQHILTAALLLALAATSAISSDAADDRGGVTINVAVIPAAFQDKAFTHQDPQTWLDGLFNSYTLNPDAGTGSVTSYLEDNLGAAYKFRFSVLEPVTLPEKASYYGGNNAAGNDSHINDLFVHACNAEEAAGVRFSSFDSDSDNNIDLVFVVFAGNNEAETDAGDDIWPMNADLSGLRKYYSGKRLSKVACYSEYSGSGRSYSAGIGTICHELLHTIGLMDLYDLNGEAEGRANPMFGSIAIMDKGNLNDNGRTPPYLCAVEREMLGILNIIEAEPDHQYFLPSIDVSNTAIKIPTSNDGEYFLIEYRSGEKWDSHIGGSGLLVYHIDKSLNRAGSMTARDRWKANAINCCADHPCAALVNITGADDVGAVFYPGTSGTSDIMSNETEALWQWNGDGVGFGISDLSESYSGAAEFSIVTDMYWHLPQVTDCNVFAGQRSASIEWEASRASNATWLIRWGAARSILMETVYPSDKEYTFSNLAPGETYLCEIMATDGSLEGKKYRIEFTTIPELTNYPLIAIPANPLKTGESLRLSIININSEPKELKWYLDGQEYTEPSVLFTKRGSHTIRATYTMDGLTYENLEKTITIE